MTISGIKGRIVTLAVSLIFLGISGFSEPARKLYPDAQAKALRWLESRMTPNATVPDPQLDRMHMILSYEIPREEPAYRYLSGRSMTYDNALAAIAFAMAGDYKNAAFILNALKRQLRGDAGLWFGYNTHNSWPAEGDRDGALDRTGATSWAGYAALFYLSRREKENPGYLSTSREAKTYLELAKRIGDCVLRLQIDDDRDPRFGLVTGGLNSYTLAFEKNAVVERFREEKIDWASTEHNFDAYFFLRDLGRMTGKKAYLTAAEKIKAALLTLWSEKDGQYLQGVKISGIDGVLALDCASWGAIFSLTAGKPAYAKACLGAVETFYRSVDDGPDQSTVKGFKPYASRPIYESADQRVADFYFPDKPGLTWKDMNGVWGEGSLGVAVALLKLGRTDEAKEVVEEIIKLQAAGGGVPYFTREIPGEFLPYPSVASTAWLVMVISLLNDRALREEFWGS